MHHRSRIGLIPCGYLLTAAFLPAYASGAGAPAISSRPAAGDVVVAASHGDVPSFVWASGPAPVGASPELAARHHLQRLRAVYGAPRAALDALRLVHVHDTGRGGIVVILRPTVDGVDVIHSDVKVLLDRGLGLRAIAGSPHPAALAGAAKPSRVSAPESVSAALRDLFGVDVPSDMWVATRAAAGRAAFTLAKARADLRIDRPARARPVYFPVGASLVPAHRVEVQATLGDGEPQAFLYVIAADDGRVLLRSEVKQRDAYSYRVWADEGGDHRPYDGPSEDFTPHPVGEPGIEPMASVPPVLVSMEGFNTNPDGVADPWLPAGATETKGNNVDAYCNAGGGESFGGTDFRASVTAPGVFDRVFDVAVDPLASEHQGMAAVTQIFYTTNYLHDWWYDSGFNEAAGNAQADNFGRGGQGGDPLLALAQDAALGGIRDNAYMVTPEDGVSPQMHMFLWSASSTDLSLTVGPNDDVLDVGQAKFGPLVYDVTADLVVVDDGMGKSPTDGCEPPLNDLTGKIVLIDRGTCAFELKANLAEAAGAVGVIFPDILPNQPAYPPGPDYTIDDPTIPGQGLSKSDGDALKAQLMNGPLTAHMVGNSPPERDGTLDNMVVAHEWGHFIHNRLVECVSWQCRGQGEGWGDFLALHMSLRPGDDLDGTYAGCNYAGPDPTFYFGIRRVPYSVDFTKNALSFRHITDGEPLPDDHPVNDPYEIANSESHNAGEIWATMMWEVYVALHKAGEGKKSFDEVRRAMSDYIVTGMMMAPAAPTYTEQRDALLAAMAVADPADFAAAAAAFARRGAGTCAVGPVRDSFDFAGVMEDFEVRPLGLISAAVVDDATMSCDQDGVVDIGEPGVLTVDLDNLGGADLAGATLKITSSSPSVTFTGETSLELEALPPQGKTTLKFPFELPEALPGLEHATFSIKMTTPGGCKTETVRELAVVLNGDRMAASSAVDDVEAEATLWEEGGNGGNVIWGRELNASSGKGWHADDLDVTTDTWLMSPTLEVAADKPFGFSFDHAHIFDATADPNNNILAWDGGVVELSVDGGKTWSDISKYADPGYNGTIASSDNVLSNRQGYVRVNPSHPLLDPVDIDLGMQFAGQKVRVRFRLGTDLATGAAGWDIDNIAFTGITTTPFAGWVADPGDCVGAVPTTSEGSETSSDTTEAPDTTGGSDSGTTSPQTGSDAGCACDSGGGTGWQALPMLALAGLLRRRRTV